MPICYYNYFNLWINTCINVFLYVYICGVPRVLLMDTRGCFKLHIHILGRVVVYVFLVVHVFSTITLIYLATMYGPMLRNSSLATQTFNVMYISFPCIYFKYFIFVLFHIHGW